MLPFVERAVCGLWLRFGLCFGVYGGVDKLGGIHTYKYIHMIHKDMILCIRKLTECLYLASLDNYVETNGRLKFKTYLSPRIHMYGVGH